MAASAPLDGALNGFVLSAGRSVPGKAGANGFGEHRAFSWDLVRAGSGGSAGMQLTELKKLLLLWVAGGRGTTPGGPGARTGAGCTGGWACGRASRLSDRSSNGSLFEGDSSLTAGTPLGFTWRETARSQKHTGSDTLTAHSLRWLSVSTALVGGRHRLRNKKQLVSLFLWWVKIKQLKSYS